MSAPCVKPHNHVDRCQDATGTTWEHNHPTCEDCTRYAGWAQGAMVRADAAEAELAELRAAVRLLLREAPGQVVAQVAGQLAREVET